MARLTRQSNRIKIGSLKDQVAGSLTHSGMLATHHTGNRYRLGVIRDNQGIRGQFHFLSIQQYQLFALHCPAHNNATLYFLTVKGV